MSSFSTPKGLSQPDFYFFYWDFLQLPAAGLGQVGGKELAGLGPLAPFGGSSMFTQLEQAWERSWQLGVLVPSPTPSVFLSLPKGLHGAAAELAAAHGTCSQPRILGSLCPVAAKAAQDLGWCRRPSSRSMAACSSRLRASLGTCQHQTGLCSAEDRVGPAPPALQCHGMLLWDGALWPSIT